MKAPRRKRGGVKDNWPQTQAFAVSQSTSRTGSLIFENRELEIKENYNSYTRSGGERSPSKRERFLKAGTAGRRSAKRIRAHDGCLGIRRR